MTGITIGVLARRAGLAAGALRYYEAQGLLTPMARNAAGYRLYRDTDLQRLRFIRRAQELGFSLDEVRALLDASTNPAAQAADVKAFARDKLCDIERRIRDLERMRAGLSILMARCAGAGPAHECPILAALSEDEGGLNARSGGLDEGT